MTEEPRKLTARERARERLRARSGDTDHFHESDIRELKASPRSKKQMRKERAEGLAEMMAEDAEERRNSKRNVPPPGKLRPSLRGPKSKIEPGEDIRKYRKTVRVGRRWTEIMVNIEDGLYTWKEFCEGLDPMELARGQLKDADGKFKGKPPTLIPREFLLECQRELKRRFDEKMQIRLLEATDEYIEMSKEVKDPKLREQMLRYIMERVVGPIPKNVEISTTPKYEGFLAGVIRKDGKVDYSSRYDRRTEDISDTKEEKVDGREKED